MVVSELHNICEALCACGAGQNNRFLCAHSGYAMRAGAKAPA